MLTGHMKHICENEESLDLEVSPEQAEKCADTILRKRGMNQIRSSSSPRIRPTNIKGIHHNVAADETYSI